MVEEPTTYDPVPFWLAQWPHLSSATRSPEHERQEVVLRRLLRRLRWATVFELGVGGGRITRLLRDLAPDALYTGLDLGPDQLAAGAAAWPGAEFVEATIQEYEPDGRQWDLVIVSEVLMHISEADMPAVAAKLRAMTARHLVAVEWVPLPGELQQPVASWCFDHDYVGLLGPMSWAERTDRQVVYHAEPT